MASPSTLELYRQMARARALELALDRLWAEGRIFGELHLGTGEEAIAAALGLSLRESDAIALDHRATPVLTAMGVDLVAVVREMLGDERGLCGGCGGHMHLFVPQRRAASSGIVGAAAPTAVGFALSAARLRPESLAVGVFGDGAMNQGMVLESLNLAVAWALPVLFVCKDNGWAITTRSESVSGGSPRERAAAFGLATWDVDGGDIEAMAETAGLAFEHVRAGHGPGFIHAACPRLDGHFAGDRLVKLAHGEIDEGDDTVAQLLASSTRLGGAGLASRAGSLVTMARLLNRARREHRGTRADPIERARRSLRAQKRELASIDAEVAAEIEQVVREAVEGAR